MPMYRDFPKGDARRYLLVLQVVDRMKDGATLHYVAIETGSTRAEVQRALQALADQFGVVFERRDTSYHISDWGVIKRTELGKLLKA